MLNFKKYFATGDDQENEEEQEQQLSNENENSDLLEEAVPPVADPEVSDSDQLFMQPDQEQTPEEEDEERTEEEQIPDERKIKGKASNLEAE